jgi:hypothetical protein
MWSGIEGDPFIIDAPDWQLARKRPHYSGSDFSPFFCPEMTQNPGGPDTFSICDG